MGNKDGLQRSYGNQALILKAWGRLEEALALHKKQEAICLELGNKDGLQACYGNQALILQAWGRLEEALALHKKEEAICLELGNKDGLQAQLRQPGADPEGVGAAGGGAGAAQEARSHLPGVGQQGRVWQRSYGNQALILKAWGRLEEALALHKKEEAICLELGNKDGLQSSYGNQALILTGVGAAGGGAGAAQEARSDLPGVGQQGRAAAQLRQPGADPERRGGGWRRRWRCCKKKEGDLPGVGQQEQPWLLLLATGGFWRGRRATRKTEKEKLEQALAIFTELKMPRERDAVQAELDKMGGE